MKIKPQKLENFYRKNLLSTFLRDARISVPVESWQLAVVLDIKDLHAEILILTKNLKLQKEIIKVEDNRWARRKIFEGQVTRFPSLARDIWAIGDIIYVEKQSKNNSENFSWRMRQVPEVQGAFVVMDPTTGEVLALQGGFSYELSSFNRATQAYRQTGSLFKPFVYFTALQKGYLPNSLILDAPIDVSVGEKFWQPENASGGWLGPAPLRRGIENSRNLMTVRLAQDIGMANIEKFTNSLGLDKKIPDMLSYSLGAGESTLIDMVSAYSVFANGGFLVKPTFFTEIQDRSGKSIFKHEILKCYQCKVVDLPTSEFPTIYRANERLLDPIKVYQLNSMLRGVVARGTAAKTVGKLGWDIAGKTGTTNKSKDAWFIGFTPKLIAGCYIGFDFPKSLGSNISGGSLCGSAFAKFIKKVLRKNEKVIWDQPDQSILVAVDRYTGKKIKETTMDKDIVLELFKIGEEPYSGPVPSHTNKRIILGEDLFLLPSSKDKRKENQSYIEFKEPNHNNIKSGDLY